MKWAKKNQILLGVRHKRVFKERNVYTYSYRNEKEEIITISNRNLFGVPSGDVSLLEISVLNGFDGKG